MTRRQERKAEREAYWRRVIEEQATSGLNHTDFCRSKSISRHSYFWWKRQLKESISKRAPRNTARKTRKAKARPKLIPVDIESLMPASTASAFEVVLSNGRVVRVPSVFDPESLQRLVVALEGSEKC